LLTDPGDLVVDIFAGSNTTGMVAEAEGRRWLAFELNREYVAASALRFVPKGLPVPGMRDIYERVLRNEPICMDEEIGFQRQLLAG
jgi:site-specific DNA-methyltransferase (cytosine-N4-specific)